MARRTCFTLSASAITLSQYAKPTTSGPAYMAPYCDATLAAGLTALNMDRCATSTEASRLRSAPLPRVAATPI
ncbi:hypothetical protein [Acidocella sp.]|uniref:hypothetical protein n=1 Tax=Acidocella sp. TaxID=50710 RepID=UPI003D05884C